MFFEEGGESNPSHLSYQDGQPSHFQHQIFKLPHLLTKVNSGVRFHRICMMILPESSGLINIVEVSVKLFV